MEQTFKTILVLITVHYILDFPLQSQFLAEYKAKKNYILFVHCFIWAGGISAALMIYGLFAWWKFAVLIIGHFCMDMWKCRGYYKKLNISDWNSLYIDQAFHIAQILMCLI